MVSVSDAVLNHNEPKLFLNMCYLHLLLSLNLIKLYAERTDKSSNSYEWPVLQYDWIP